MDPGKGADSAHAAVRPQQLFEKRPRNVLVSDHAHELALARGHRSNGAADPSVTARGRSGQMRVVALA